MKQKTAVNNFFTVENSISFILKIFICHQKDFPIVRFSVLPFLVGAPATDIENVQKMTENDFFQNDRNSNFFLGSVLSELVEY